MSLEWWAVIAAPPCRLPGCGHSDVWPDFHVKEALCSVCGTVSAPRIPPGPDFVPTPELTWLWAERKKSRRLRFIGQASRASGVESVGDLVATVSSLQPHAIRLRAAPLRPHVPPPAAGKYSFLVWRASTMGCKVLGGTVELSKVGVLLLAGRGAHFHGTTFRGGFVMCAGAEYDGTFTDCTFTGAAVYAVHGAAVALRGCTVHDSHPGITASGAATKVMLRTCAIRESRTCIIAEAGATLRAQHCSILAMASGVFVNGAATHAVLEGCRFFSPLVVGVGYIIMAPDTAVAARRGTAQLKNCHVAGFKSVAFGAYASTSIELRKVTAIRCYQGVVLLAHARALVCMCSFSCGYRNENGHANGLALCDAYEGCGGDADASPGGACAQVERSDFRGARGISVFTGGAAAVSLCTFEGPAEVLKSCAEGCRATLSHCTGIAPESCVLVQAADGKLRIRGGSYEGRATACCVSNGMTLAATGCKLSSREEPDSSGVVQVSEGSAGWLLGCRVHKGVIGVVCGNATLSVVDTEVSDMRVVVPGDPDAAGRRMHAAAGIMTVGGRTTVRGGTIERCVVGVEARSGPHGESHVTVDGVTVTDCYVGVFAQDTCEVQLTRCDILGPKRERRCGSARNEMLNRRFEPEESAAVSLSDHAAGSLSHCALSGYKRTVVAMSAGELAVRHCELTVIDTGMCFAVTHRITVEDSVVQAEHGAHGTGLCAVPGSECMLRRCCFSAVGVNGILALGSSSVTAVDSDFSGECQTALSARDGARVLLQDCTVSGACTGIAMSGGGVSVRAKRVKLEATGVQVKVVPEAQVRMVLAAPPQHAVSGAAAGLKMVDCMLHGGNRGVLVKAAAAVSLLRCQVSNAQIAVQLFGPVRARVNACSVWECRAGLVVGATSEELAHRCQVCDRAGQSAVKAALSGVGQGVREGVKCVHEGAVASLTVSDSTVSQCDYGVMVHPHGHVEAEGVTAEACGTGVVVVYIRDQSRFSGCRAVGCQEDSYQRSTDLDGDDGAPQLPIPGIEVAAVATRDEV